MPVLTEGCVIERDVQVAPGLQLPQAPLALVCHGECWACEEAAGHQPRVQSRSGPDRRLELDATWF
eukprot:5864449-Pyramimonas_sp.AAC.1